MRILNNSVQLAGSLANDPELRFASDGTPVVNFRLRILSSNHERSSKQEDRTSGQQYFSLIAWRGMAREIDRNFRKGNRIMVRGELRNRLVDSQSKRAYRTEIHVHEFLALSSQTHRAAMSSHENALSCRP